jgi:hypothetical protein
MDGVLLCVALLWNMILYEVIMSVSLAFHSSLVLPKRWLHTDEMLVSGIGGNKLVSMYLPPPHQFIFLISILHIVRVPLLCYV